MLQQQVGGHYVVTSDADVEVERALDELLTLGVVWTRRPNGSRGIERDLVSRSATSSSEGQAASGPQLSVEPV